MPNQPESPSNRHRRHLLLGLSALLGEPLARSVLSDSAVDFAQAFQAREEPTASGRLLDTSAMMQLMHICQTVIPASDTLGAGDVDTQGFIDDQLWHCYAEPDHDRVLKILEDIDNIASARYASSFSALEGMQQQQILNALDLGKRPFNSRQQTDFRFLKALIVFGYFTSKEGASKALLYVPFPGDFKGSVPYKDVGKAYGNYAYYPFY